MSCQQMDFPETFDEFAESYGFRDKEEIYTNGAELIPVFRVKQWLQHIQKPTRMVDKSNFSMEQYREDTDCAYDCGYNKGFKDGIKSMSDKPTVEAIPKDQYEARLKADMVAMLTKIQLEIEELDTPNNGSAYMDCAEIIQQKINELQAESEEKE